MENKFARGSEWRIWDFHIHTPASYGWKGKKLTNPNLQSQDDIDIIDEMIEALNRADAEVFVLMDYFTFDGWFALQNRLKMPNSPKLNKVVFPGIELRVAAPVSFRMNAHLIFTDKCTVDELDSALKSLKIDGLDKNDDLSKGNLVAYARSLNEDRIKKIEVSLTTAKLQADYDKALEIGLKTAKISERSYLDIADKFGDKVVAFMPWDAYNGLIGVDWEEHNSFLRKMMSYPKVFETRNNDFINTFKLVKTEKNVSYFDSFKSSLGGNPSLPVSGSDAHKFSEYARFPQGKRTWIKADITFEGLLQAIREPANRSFIGDKPKKIQLLESNPEKYISSLSINKVNVDSTYQWFDSVEQNLNFDLVAIIGNKGSGKSAFIDVISHVFQDKVKYEYENFVDKFNGLNIGKNFNIEVGFHNDIDRLKSNLERHNNNFSDKVTYIPQRYFEDLCNNLNDSKFQGNINEIIYSYLLKSDSFNTNNYGEYIDQLELITNKSIQEDISKIKIVNKDIVGYLNKIAYEERSKIEERHRINQKYLESCQKELAILEGQFADVLGSKYYQEVQDSHTIMIDSLKYRNTIDEKYINMSNETSLLEESVKELERMANNFESQIQDFNKNYLKKIEYYFSKVVSFNIDSSEIKKVVLIFNKQTQELRDRLFDANEDWELKNRTYEEKLTILNGENDEASIKRKRIHELKEIVRKTCDVATMLTINIADLEKFQIEVQRLTHQRIGLISKISDKIKEKVNKRQFIFEGVAEEIQSIRDRGIEINLNLQAEVYFNRKKFKSEVSRYINMRHGFLNINKIDETIEKCLLESNNNYSEFPINFLEKLENINGEQDILLQGILKDSVELEQLYDYLYSLDYLEVKNKIQYMGTDLKVLSPGQRGELLLILFLLLDKSDNPLLIDQPEENLDNQTIYNVLVPIIKEARNKRQVIMVTHNPNLAVVCDAEQIIYANFERNEGNKISYTSGSIENPKTKAYVIDVLEGTIPAFINRQRKYGLA